MEANKKNALLIIHGDKDTLAPFSMAYRIYDSCRTRIFIRQNKAV